MDSATFGGAMDGAPGAPPGAPGVPPPGRLKFGWPGGSMTAFGGMNTGPWPPENVLKTLKTC